MNYWAICLIFMALSFLGLVISFKDAFAQKINPEAQLLFIISCASLGGWAFGFFALFGCN